jgi:hypothetical protein
MIKLRNNWMHLDGRRVKVDLTGESSPQCHHRCQRFLGLLAAKPRLPSQPGVDHHPVVAQLDHRRRGGRQ